MAELVYHAFRLSFSSGLHLSRGRADSYEQSLTTLHSDTLKSALFVSALELYGEVAIGKAWLDAFTVSSAFPFRGEEHFFPKPLARLPKLADLADEKQGKKMKNLRWLGQSYFEKLLAGNEAPYPQKHLLEDGRYLSDKLSADAAEKIITHELQQHVAVPRDGAADPTPYYTERLHFAVDAGLYFLMQTTDPEVLKQVQAALRLLGDTGLGTDKHLGNGRFTAGAPTKLRLRVPDKAPAQTSLSLYCPTREDLLTAPPTHTLTQYALVRRGGYLASPRNPDHLRLRKRSVYMMLEGSVWPCSTTGQLLRGACVDLQPTDYPIGHPVWRDGRALFVPLNPLPEDLSPTAA